MDGIEPQVVDTKRSPLGEARRLRYFVLISSKLLESPSIDMDLFIEKLLKASELINPELLKYIRNTGVLRSRAVARNYLRFADWLDFLRIEGRIVIPNGYTVFLANIDDKQSFFLTKKEKISFFLRLINLKDFRELICHLRINNYIKDYVSELHLSEHFVESYFEWLVDLGILRPKKTCFGSFTLTSIGYQMREALNQNEAINGKYVQLLLSTNISTRLDISDDSLWSLMKQAINKLGRNARSEVDNYLFSAYPLVLEIQIQLVMEHNIVVTVPDLVKKLKEIANNYDSSFNWDNLANSGYIKVGSMK